MSRGVVAAAGVALLLLFGVVAFESVARRAENYSYYPDYSSLNNEDTGLKAYYETLVRLDVRVSRNYRPFLKLEGQRATVIYAGPNLGDFRSRSAKDLEQFERVAQGGARVLILFQTREIRYEKIVTPKPEVKPSGKGPSTWRDEMKPRIDTMRKRWGVEEAETEVTSAKRPAGAEALTPSIVRRDVLWHFANWDPMWKPVRLGPDSNPVLLERGFGEGSIGLIAAVEPFTNYQLLTRPDAALLAATTEGRHPLIFDEAHLGVGEIDTVAGLARQHHLEWILLGFLTLGMLYIWRNAVSFMPPLQSAAEGGVKGRDAHSALSSLLAQSVGHDKLLKEIAAEWKHSERYIPNAGRLGEAELAYFAAASLPNASEAYLSLVRKRSVFPDHAASAGASIVHIETRTTGETKLVP
jgi:hypothetical protein